MSTQERIQKMRKMRTEGYSLSDIAKEFGLSIATVYDYVKDVSYNSRGRKKRGQALGADDIRKIIDLYKEGLSIGEVARRTGYHYHTVRKYVRMWENGKLAVE